MEISRKWRFSSWLCLFVGIILLLATTLQSVQGEEESEAPSQCKPYIEKALKEQQKDELVDGDTETIPETPADDSDATSAGEHDDSNDIAGDSADSTESIEAEQADEAEQVSAEAEGEPQPSEEDADQSSAEQEETEQTHHEDVTSAESKEGEMQGDQPASVEVDKKQSEEAEEKSEETRKESAEEEGEDKEDEAVASTEETGIGEDPQSAESQEAGEQAEPSEEHTASAESHEISASATESAEKQIEPAAEEGDSVEATHEAEAEAVAAESTETTDETETTEPPANDSTEASPAEAGKESAETEEVKSAEADSQVEESLEVKEEADQVETAAESVDVETSKESEADVKEEEEEDHPSDEEEKEAGSEAEEESKEAVPEEDLIQEIEIPDNLRPRDHIDQLLKLDESNSQAETILNRLSDNTLKELKKLYETAIKPLETLYKYRDLSNRHFGDSEIFSKPLVVFMGPWSGGKSSIINYLLDNEYNITSLRTGAEPSPAYFNLLMHGDEPEVLDGTQLAADFTFAGLQKFGQGLEERLRGLKLPNKLLEKINIVEIPGILEVRKQVSRVFPFNDACQWFIDRADIIFLVYDPSKLDVGPETEAILDQLKGREHQTRIVLNKADQVQPEELMRVQSALIWNISPLMSSAQPPVMYTTSLWSRPYETWAPVRLLHAQERAFLRDLRTAVDKRIENKISSARRFAVRVRNHAKMVDCYLTTYYNHKSVFGNRKQVSDQIIDHPQDYHIYEGLSTLTNISRYDLPDPDVYKDFFRLNALYDFQQLSATCTYFRGCPINRLDVAIAYDLPELVGKYKKNVESALAEIRADAS